MTRLRFLFFALLPILSGIPAACMYKGEWLYPVLMMWATFCSGIVIGMWIATELIDYVDQTEE